MKNRKFTLILIALLLAVTAVVAAVYLTNRPAAAEGALRVEYGGQTAELSLDRLEPVPVRGVLVNGRGEEKAIETQGVPLSQVLREAGASGYAEVTVTADDAYSAVVTSDEINAPDRVYLIQEEDGPRLIVFGDSDSKRSVSGVVRLTVR